MQRRDYYTAANAHVLYVTDTPEQIELLFLPEFIWNTKIWALNKHRHLMHLKACRCSCRSDIKCTGQGGILQHLLKLLCNR